MQSPANPVVSLLTAAALSLALSNAFGQPQCTVPGESTDMDFPPCVDGGATMARNILATFGPLADLPAASEWTSSYCDDLTGSFVHRGVTYTPLNYPESFSVVIGGTFDDTLGFGDLFDCRPVTRFVKTPLLATIADADAPYVGVEIRFDEPTPIFGFGFGYNDYAQKTDGKLTGPVGMVTLYNAHDRVIRKSPLFASRLYCCTEGKFDYVAHERRHRHGLVSRAVIKLTRDFVPFDPATGLPGDLAPKFLGVDWVRYQRTEDVPDCPAQPD